MSDMMTPDTVIGFWFEEITPAQHWKVDPDFDAQIRDRFAELHAQANRCELFEWRRTPRGRLAEIIVLDQFSRQMFRGEARAFASDPLALALAQEAVRAGDDVKLTAQQRTFLYMPYMHSESLSVHDEAVRLFTGLGNADTLDYEKKHRDVIARFGRYPKRNAALGRHSTAEEEAYIASAEGMF